MGEGDSIMTEAGWTRPKEVNQAGWYWLRRVGSLAVVEVIAVPGYEPKHWIVEGANLRWSLGNMDGEFLGPITPTDRQQGRVAAFKESIEKLREREKFYSEQEAISEGQMRLTRGLQRNESSGCIHELEQLAQAVQDEKGVGDGKTR